MLTQKFMRQLQRVGLFDGGDRIFRRIAEVVEELQARARDVLLTRAIATEEQLDGSAQSDDIFEVEGMTEELASTLAAAGVLCREDLAEQSVDELLEIAPMDAEVAGELIMSARAVWFEDEEQA